MAKNLSYHLKSNSSFQWSCSVQAGVQDRLVWLHEGKEILDIDPDVVDGTNHTNVTEGVYNSNSIEVNISSFVVSKIINTVVWPYASLPIHYVIV